MSLKIVSARVDDPRRSRRFIDPSLTIVVDDEVMDTGNPIFDYRKDLQHRIIPCGPFYDVEVRPNLGETYGEWVGADEHRDGSIGRVNTAGIVKDQIIRVWVDMPEETHVPFYMSVVRARRVMRQNNISYLIVIDEQAALGGEIKWRLESKRAVCYGGANPRNRKPCTAAPVNTIVYRGTHLNLCRQHQLEFNHVLQRDRQQRNALNNTRKIG